MQIFLNTGSEFHIEKTDPCHLGSRSIYCFSVVSNVAILFTNTDTYIHRYINTDRQTDRQTGRQAGRQRGRYIYIHTYLNKFY